MAALPALRYEGVSKVYRQGSADVHALRDLHLTIPSGQFVAIVGASGSGKSTLLHLTAALTRPSSGEIYLHGEPVGNLNDEGQTRLRRDKIAIIFQSFNLFPTMTALENVLFPALLTGRSDASTHERAVKLLEDVRLGQRQNHRPDELSGGEQQRVAIARALIHDAPLMLADEPTGNLDSSTGEQVLGLLRDLVHTHKRTLMLVTHDSHAASYADRIIEMRDGSILHDSGA